MPLSLPPIGHHMQYISTVADTLRLINGAGGTAVQISLGSPAEKALRSISDTDATTVNKIKKKHGFYIVVHGKFLYNFCRPSGTDWQVKLLIKELEQANKIGADVVIHQGKNMPELGISRDMAVQNFADHVSGVLRSVPHLTNKILLENAARQGSECGYSLDELIDIHQRLDPEILHKVGYCIDLCHIFVAGELDVRDATCTAKWFARFHDHIGYDKLSLIHFNDSNVDFNTRNDNHGSVPIGFIGKVSTGGFKVVTRLCTEHSIPMILETPSGEMTREIQQLKDWATI